MTWTKSVLLSACPKILQDVRKLDISDGAEVRQRPCLLQIHAYLAMRAEEQVNGSYLLDFGIGYA